MKEKNSTKDPKKEGSSRIDRIPKKKCRDGNQRRRNKEKKKKKKCGEYSEKAGIGKTINSNPKACDISDDKTIYHRGSFYT